MVASAGAAVLFLGLHPMCCVHRETVKHEDARSLVKTKHKRCDATFFQQLVGGREYLCDCGPHADEEHKYFKRKEDCENLGDDVYMVGEKLASFLSAHAVNGDTYMTSDWIVRIYKKMLDGWKKTPEKAVEDFVQEELLPELFEVCHPKRIRKQDEAHQCRNFFVAEASETNAARCDKWNSMFDELSKMPEKRSAGNDWKILSYWALTKFKATLVDPVNEKCRNM